jgi:hypothetical protein
MLGFSLGLGLSQRRAITSPAFSLANTTVADNAAAGATVGALTVPSGYTAFLAEDEFGRFALSGNNLVTTSVRAAAGEYRPLLYAMNTVNDPIYLLTPVITVQSVWTPAQLGAKLVGAIDFSAAPAGAINSIASAEGLSNTWTNQGTAPVAEAGAVNGGSVAVFNGSATRGLVAASTITLAGACSIYIVEAEDFTGSTRGLIGVDTTNRELLRVTIANPTNGVISVRMSTGAAGNLNLTRPLAKGIKRWRFRRDAGGTVTVSVNGLVLGTIATQGGTSNWNAIGYNASGSSPFIGGIVRAYWVDETTPMTADELALMDMFLEGKNPSGVLVSNAGSDSNYGWTDSRALATIDHAKIQPFGPTDTIQLKRGSTWVRQSLFLSSANSKTATVTNPMRVFPYGTGDAPVIDGRNLVTGFAFASGVSSVTTALTFGALTAGYLRGTVTKTVGGVTTKLLNAISGGAQTTTPPADQWSYVAGVLYIGGDVTAAEIRVGHDGALAAGGNDDAGIKLALGAAFSGASVRGVNVIGWPNNGIRNTGSAATGQKAYVHSIEERYSAGDGFNFSGAIHCRASSLSLEAGSGVPGTSASSGDNESAHGTSTLVSFNNVDTGGFKGGSLHERPSIVDRIGGQIIRAHFPAKIENQGSGADGVFRLLGVAITRGASAGTDNVIEVEAGIASTYALTVSGCTLIGEGAQRGIGIVRNTATLTQGNNTQTGLNSLT